MMALRHTARIQLLLVLPLALAAQVPDVRAQLEERGVPAALAGQVAVVVEDAASRGLPVGPLAEKAIEGWAKHVPPPRIVAAVRQLAERLGTAQTAVVMAGVTNPSGELVAAAAEALGRGMTAADVSAVLQAAPTPEAAEPGLTVAAALAAQGLARNDATGAVVESYRGGRSMGQILELPSVAQALMAGGVPVPEVAKLLRGPPPGRGHGAGVSGGRPPNVPPGVGPPTTKPGKRKGGS